MQLTEFIIIHILSICCLLDVSSTRSPPTATILPKIYFDPDKDSNDIFGLMSNDDMRGVAAILAKRTNRERMEIKISYSQLYGRNLKEDVAGKTKDEFHRLLKALLSPVPDYLIEEINWSLDQGKNWEYMSIICTSPGDLLKEMVYKYNNTFGWQLRDIFSSNMRQADGIQFMQSIVDSNPIRPNTSVVEGLIENQITLIPDRNVRYALDPVGYFATEIHDAKSDDRGLTLAILSRCEIDLVLIKERFETTYQTRLEKWIEDHAKGDYENTLKIIISGKEF